MKHLKVHLTDEIYEQIEKAAAHERRTAANQLICLLERSLAAETRQPGAIVAADPSYAARPVLVIAELSDLQGPAGGKIVLPSYLHSDPAGQIFDLDQTWDLAEAYRIVLNGSASALDLARWLNAPRLIETWPQLGLPVALQRAWQQIHSVLASADEPGNHAD